ncbi:low temperature requirement protein A [Frankia sp. Ag45/Mut15]|uniref:Low temperature requirement protein A n=1 Tax=Frankia umida TaxID=573489 RepID=A0ABT0K6A0_9ACTN|nr:low temperature requirement protein A [Frankia umida]MCK9879039.1 low temperature requirement protein A [Frankia umida]
MAEGAGTGKRVTWVELYFDLIFVFAVGQSAHIMVADPDWSGFGRALGLFMPLWWAWIGFVILYNRHGDDRATQRLFMLAGTLPCAVAAVETHAAADGHATAFILALAGIRLVLAVGFLVIVGRSSWVALGYGLSTVAFAVSAVVPGPWRIALWVFALLQEAAHLLLRDDDRGRRRGGSTRTVRGPSAGTDGEVAGGPAGVTAGRPARERPARRSRAAAVRARFRRPVDPARRVDAAHLAERFGLMMIILLGEVVIAVGEPAAEAAEHDAHYWLGLLSGLVLASALWWLYFTAAAPINEAVLRASGGHPAMAYGLYAGGHLSSAFALITMAAGVSLALSGEEEPTGAAWLLTIGLAVYLEGTRGLTTWRSSRPGRVLHTVVIGGTVCLALLRPLISTLGVLLVATAWAITLAAYVSWRAPERLRQVNDGPRAFLHSSAARD